MDIDNDALFEDPVSDDVGGMWKEELKRAATDYVDADDALRSVNKDVKPLREQRTSSRATVMGIMLQQGLEKVRVQDIGMQFVLKAQRYKVPLNKDRLRVLCQKFFAGNPETAEKLYTFLTEPEYEDRMQLKKKKSSDSDNKKKKKEEDYEDDEE